MRETKEQDEAPVFQQPKDGIMRKIDQIENIPFGAHHEGKDYNFNPNSDEIQHAIDKEQYDARGIQSHRAELDREWWEKSMGDLDVIAQLQREYHARRIAYLAVNGWPDPLRVEANGKMHDGLHRLRAAIHRKMTEVAVTIVALE